MREAIITRRRQKEHMREAQDPHDLREQVRMPREKFGAKDVETEGRSASTRDVGQRKKGLWGQNENQG